jgi:arylsulfatase A-like enzyme
VRALLLLALSIPAAAAADKPRVVIVSIDGLRPDAITDEGMPQAAKLGRAGAVAKRALTIPRSDTLPSHASMLSGVEMAAHGLDWNSFRIDRGFIKVPTVFAIARRGGLTTAMIVGKQKLRHIAKPGTVDHFDIPSDPTCAGVAAAAAAYFTSTGPDLMFVHFSDPDDAGHDHGWSSAEYTRAVAIADTCLGVLVSTIDKSAAAKTTTIIVTADHGGEGRSHSDGREGANRRIPWMIRGPSIKPGTTVRDVSTMDTAATALSLLGLARPANLVGKPRVR